MNILMMSLLYPEDQLDEVNHNAKDKLQNQINNYQRAFMEGIEANLQAGERLDLLNSLPVGIFPIQYRQLFLKKGWHDGGKIHQLGCLNLPWFKQKGRQRGAVREIQKWIKANPNNRTLLLYTQYLPYMEAVAKVKRKVPDLKATIIVTDIPNEYGLASGRRGILKKIEYAFGNRSVKLCQMMDGFVLLTEPMAEALQVQHKPYVVIEGLIRRTEEDKLEQTEEQSKAVLYTGTLEPDLGIQAMLDAFAAMPEYELWICGTGSMQEQVRAYAQRHENIQYFGFVPQKEALALQAKAAALINPRTPKGIFTRYSFPSKTLEYLRSGKPVLCYKLEGIPSDYDDYLQYISTSDSEGIKSAVQKIMGLASAERKAIGSAGRAFVLDKKNPATQCKSLIAFLRQL